MAYFYVKTGGTATGDGGRTTSLRTGTWNASTADYYDEVQDVFSVPTTSFVAGDTIIASHLHARSSTASVIYDWTDSNTVSSLLSVDDANQDTLKAGAQETCTSSSNDVLVASVGGSVYIYGFHFTSSDNITPGSTESWIICDECTFEVTGLSDIASYLGSDGAYLELNNHTFKLGNAGAQPMRVTNGARLFMRGGSIDGTGASPNAFFSGVVGGNGGAWITVEGFDFSNLSATGDLIASSTGAASALDNINFRAVGCKIPSGASLYDGVIDTAGGERRYEFIGVDSADQYRYLYKIGLGTVIQEKTTVVTASTPFEGSQKLSFKIDTASACGPSAAFWWPLPISYADMSAAGSDRALLYVTSDSDPLDDEVQVILGWPDSTDDTLYKYGNSGQVAESGLWTPKRFNTTGSSYATASVWTSGKTFERQLPVTASSADATSPFPPRAWLVVMKSTGANSIYVNSEFVFD